MTEEQEQIIGSIPYLFEPESSEPLQENVQCILDDSRMDNTEWCSCGNCAIMDRLEENICCQEIQEYKSELENVKCITSHPGFEPVCLNNYVLKVAHRHYSYERTITNLTNRQLKFTAYKQITRWIHGWLGKRNRKVIPACAVKKINSVYPTPSRVGFVGASTD